MFENDHKKYFNQLTGACSTRKLFKIHNAPVFSGVQKWHYYSGLQTIKTNILLWIDLPNNLEEIVFFSRFWMSGICIGGFFLGTFRANSWELNFLRTKIFRDLLSRTSLERRTLNCVVDSDFEYFDFPSGYLPATNGG